MVVGVGNVWNRLDNYNEVSSPNSRSAPLPNQFRNHTFRSFAYEAGLGVQKVLLNDTKHHMQYVLGLDYRYFNFGTAKLDTFAGQVSNDRFGINNISMQTANVSLNIAFE